MKKVFTLMIASAALVFSAKAQNAVFKPFKVDVSAGYAIPSGSGSKGGIALSVEPKYGINDNISVGLRIEGAAMARAIAADQDHATGDIKFSSSTIATGDYYFSKNTFRPFAGLGFGFYKCAGTTISDGGYSMDFEAKNKFGAMIRTGFEAGHFRLGIEYNLVGKSTYDITESADKYTLTSKNNYLTFKVGVCFGGGRK